MQRLIELRCTGEIRLGIFSVGSSGRDIRRATREGGHPAKVVGSGKGERASRVGEDEGTPHSHGRIPIAVPGSNQCQDHGRSFALIGRATIPVASLRSLIDCCISFYPPTNLLFETVARKIESIQRDERKENVRNRIVQIYFLTIYCRTKRTPTLSRVFDKTMLNRGVGSRGMSPSSLKKTNNYFIPPIRSVILLIICINKVMLAGQYKIFSSTIRGIDGISPKNRERNDLSLLFDSIKL